MIKLFLEFWLKIAFNQTTYMFQAQNRLFLIVLLVKVNCLIHLFGTHHSLGQICKCLPCVRDQTVFFTQMSGGSYFLKAFKTPLSEGPPIIGQLLWIPIRSCGAQLLLDLRTCGCNILVSRRTLEIGGGVFKETDGKATSS